MSDTQSADAEALADAVRAFLAVPVVERAVASGRSWSKEWLGTGNKPNLRIGDVLPLADALERFDASQLPRAAAGTDAAAGASLWRIEQRETEYVAVNDTTGEVWSSPNIFAVCMAIAAGGNDLNAPAQWLRFLSDWMDAAAEQEASEDDVPGDDDDV